MRKRGEEQSLLITLTIHSSHTDIDLLRLNNSEVKKPQNNQSVFITKLDTKLPPIFSYIFLCGIVQTLAEHSFHVKQSLTS